jgi:hypothetical protein
LLLLKTAALPRLRGAALPVSLKFYIQNFPVVLGGVIDLNGLGTLLLRRVSSENVYFIFEDEGEACGAGRTHGRQISPFF